MALKQYFNIVLVPLKFIPKRTASFWQTIKIPNRFVLKICTGGFADYKSVPKLYLLVSKILLRHSSLPRAETNANIIETPFSVSPPISVSVPPFVRTGSRYRGEVPGNALP